MSILSIIISEKVAIYLVSAFFGAILSLVIYIWQISMRRIDRILEKVNENLDQLKIISSNHEIKIEILEKKM